MTAPADGYDAYYQGRLWYALPEMYQALDIIGEDEPGPLRELLNRIGVQAAVVRRSIDGLWADQSIETCSDWIIPYLGDLVAARLLPWLDPRGQRLDVANTIAWRRRKGTVATAAGVARGITGWDAHVVEGFRRLARTRHDLDPPPVRARPAEPLATAPAGGFADLRRPAQALLTGGPFGQASHHADVRRGGGAVGWYGPEKIIVYCWRLLSLAATGVTPVRVAGSHDEFTFDPTGREIPLFLPPAPDADGTGRGSPWRLPGPLTAAVDRLMTEAGAPAAYRVDGATAGGVRPEAGRFRLAGTAGSAGKPATPGLASPAVTVSYYYGFGGPVGAGTGELKAGPPARVTGEQPVTGGSGLDGALTAAHAGGTVTITDSLTYTALADVNCAAGGAGTAPLTVRARPGARPLIRFPEHPSPEDRPQWVFHGGKGARLVLDGLFASGGDIVLRGSFEHVKIVGCTFDPGTADPGPRHAIARSADGRALLPTRLWIEPGPGQPGQAGRQPGPPDAVRYLEIDRSILGPVRTRGGGLAEHVEITDSIVQGLRTSAAAAFTAADVFDPALLYDQLSPGRPEPERPRAHANPLSAFLWRHVGGHISPAQRRRLLTGPQPAADARQALADALNGLLDRDLYDSDRWAGVPLSPGVRALLDDSAANRRLNRLLLEDAYPLALAPAACAVAEATVRLNRVTVLGRLAAHRLHATDSILHGFTVAADPGDGCFRYSAALTGSRLPRPFNSAWLSGGAALFTSTAFGHPGYAQLLDTADRAIVSGAPGRTLLAGSSAGAQLGAFPAQIVPVKERALRAKYDEYLPLGLMPVIVHVT